MHKGDRLLCSTRVILMKSDQRGRRVRLREMENLVKGSRGDLLCVAGAGGAGRATGAVSRPYSQAWRGVEGNDKPRVRARELVGSCDAQGHSTPFAVRGGTEYVHAHPSTRADRAVRAL